MRVLVWQWGRRGAGPRFAAMLAERFNDVPGTRALLSLSTGAELLRARTPPVTDLYFKTYRGMGGFARRVLLTPLLTPRLERWLREQRIEAAVCAMPAALDLVMAAALRRAGVPFAVVVHDAYAHPGDIFPAQMQLQRRLIRQADGLFALTSHVAAGLRRQRLAGDKLFMASHPPFAFGPPPSPPGAHGGRLRLLSFGRLLPYKGLDLLVAGLRLLDTAVDFELRVVGQGPETPELDELRAIPRVTVENRWVPEDELGALLAWSDVLILSHREASQSGVAAAAIAARRWVVATRVGGLTEQLTGEPTALLCEPTGPSIAQALSHILEQPLGDIALPGADWSGTATGMLDALASLRDKRK